MISNVRQRWGAGGAVSPAAHLPHPTPYIGVVVVGRGARQVFDEVGRARVL